MTTHGIFFPEAPSYLLVSPLGEGATAKVMTVRDQPTGQIYVRKRTVSANTTQMIYNVPREVWAARKLGPHELIPLLVDFHEGPAEWWTTLFQWCNGGDLDNLRDRYSEFRRPVPEAMIWHVVASLVRAVAFLRHVWREGEGALVEWEMMFHGDWHPGNVFLHYDTGGGEVPRVLMGDLGNAMCPPENDDVNDIPDRPRPGVIYTRHWVDDIVEIRKVVRVMMLASWDNRHKTFNRYDAYDTADMEGEEEGVWADMIDRRVYSEALWDAVGRLDRRFPYEDFPSALELAEELVPLAERKTAELGEWSVKWTQLASCDKPVLFQSYCQQFSEVIKAVGEPWYWVEVNKADSSHSAIDDGENERIRGLLVQERHIISRERKGSIPSTFRRKLRRHASVRQRADGMRTG